MATFQKPAPKINTTSPLSESEAHAIFTKVDSSISALLHQKIAPTIHVSLGSDAIATRSKLIEEFYSIYQATYPYFKLQPRRQYCDPSAIRLPSKERDEAIKLIQWGFLPPTSPLIMGPKDYESLDDFGAELGIYLGQLGVCTHLPEIAWSPEIEKTP